MCFTDGSLRRCVPWFLLAGLFGGCGAATGLDTDGTTGSSPGTGGASGSGGVHGTGGRQAGGARAAGGKASSGGQGTPPVGSSGKRSEHWASDYDQRCNTDADCTLVSEGPECECRKCANATISASAIDDWWKDMNGCSLPAGCSILPCEPITATCNGGVCTVPRSTMVDTTRYDRECTFDTDCRLIPTGDYCSPTCNCTSAAVSVKGYERFLADFGDLQCELLPLVCDCQMGSRAVCVLDTPDRGHCQARF